MWRLGFTGKLLCRPGFRRIATALIGIAPG